MVNRELLAAGKHSSAVPPHGPHHAKASNEINADGCKERRRESGVNAQQNAEHASNNRGTRVDSPRPRTH